MESSKFMQNTSLKAKVRSLRENGKTYSEIQSILHKVIPKGTLSYWCMGVRLPNWYKEKIKEINKIHIEDIRPLALLVNQRKRKEYLDSLLGRNIHLLDKIDLSIQKLLLSILYLGEGAKHKST